MRANVRLLELQEDLIRNARQLDELCQGLEGHARFLRYSVHSNDAGSMGDQAEDLRNSAGGMRWLARQIRP